MAVTPKGAPPELAETPKAEAEPVQEYPRWLYHKDGVQRRVVANADEAKLLGGDWSETPVDAKDEKK